MSDFFTDLVYAQEDVITFPHGVPGFESNKEFVIVSLADYAPFEWLVCIDGSKLRFAIVNPLLFLPDYEPKMTKEHLDEMKIAKHEDILLYTIITIRVNPADSTANLAGPILINKAARLGKQIIIDDDRYTTQEPILRKK